MDELIHVDNSSYSKYEELLLRRDNLKKEAYLYDRAYIRAFGDKMLKNFEIKIACIRMKKEITYCQTILNHGGLLDEDELREYLETQMAEYQAQLDAMIENNKAAKKSENVSSIDLLEIKKTYRKLAKMIHPDINPKAAEHPELMELWDRVVIAYECNNLKDIKELEVLISEALESLGLGKLDIQIPDIAVKIAEVEAEILEIRNTDPYLYKNILESKTATEEKNKELDEEYSSYEDYKAQLEELLNGIKGELEIYG